MSTYAYWRLWVGARMGDIDFTKAPSRTNQILDQMHEGKPYEIEDLKLGAIYMHGEIVGIGVEVSELGWNIEIGDENVFDTTKVIKAQELVPRVQKVFDDMGVVAPILIIHHIDLGG